MLAQELLDFSGDVVARNPGLFGPDAAHNLRLEQILARLAEHRHPGMEADTALSKMGKEQLWDDVSEEPLETVGFVASKVGRIWSHGPREVMYEPGWELLHWTLLVFSLIGLIVLALRRRWEALLIAVIFLAITAISALLVASPRRVLVMMPLLGFYASLVSIIGGGLFCWLSLGIPPITFVQRIREVVPLTDLYVGLVKAPVFGAIIAIAGCFQGMLVEADAEQVGTRTTSAVVQAIFLVIVLDAFFAVFFTWIGWI